ncbi:Uridine-cytidine kinase-like 1 [Spraguea lophii 42_110]|uniref:Uridine-cytidine kinase-like 1 n=1 Tax=Spraguea lophii (strain 42_110) TaxID=1358809 RepID=S7XQ44_SPRLO|nr:Uridine-cytidine kinase-like 1 [Spraguea lophii 42_110]
MSQNFEEEMNEKIKEKLTLEEDKKNVIVIHGPSCSGKSTFANNLKKALDKQKISNILINLDHYYKTTTHRKENKYYNFDNPGALDFDKAFETLKTIDDNLDQIPLYEADFVEEVLKGPFFIKNFKPRVIIFEGLYSFNLFNDKSFDIKEFNPFTNESSDKLIHLYEYNNFSVFKIRFTVDEELQYRKKVERDVEERSRTLEFAMKQFKEQTLPATKRWVNLKDFTEDITIYNGNFKTRMIENLIKSIICFLAPQEDLIVQNNLTCYHQEKYEKNL